VGLVVIFLYVGAYLAMVHPLRVGKAGTASVTASAGVSSRLSFAGPGWAWQPEIARQIANASTAAAFRGMSRAGKVTWEITLAGIKS
jgi:hypothetical protein